MNKVLLVIGSILIAMALWMSKAYAQATNELKIFENGYIEATGISEEGQSRLQSLRAAEVIAQRNLLQILEGLSINSSTTVREGMLQNDDITSTVNGFLRGALKCGEKYNAERKSAEICLRLYIRGKGSLYETVLPLLKSDRFSAETQTYYKPETDRIESPDYQSISPPVVSNDADGLIVDVRDFEFRPALVNRIITERNEMLFDPSKIVNNILVERGCGGFTNDINKAGALLENWGSSSPMTVKAIQVLNLTDVQVSANDASFIFSNDQKTGFLAQARVVFVLK